MLVRALQQMGSDRRVSQLQQTVTVTTGTRGRTHRVTTPNHCRCRVRTRVRRVFHLRKTVKPTCPSVITSNSGTYVLRCVRGGHRVRTNSLLLVSTNYTCSCCGTSVAHAFPIKKRFSTRRHVLCRLMLRTRVGTVTTIQPNTPFGRFRSTTAHALARNVMSLKLLINSISALVRRGGRGTFFVRNAKRFLKLSIRSTNVLHGPSGA